MANEKRTIQSFFAPVAKKAKPVAEAPAAANEASAKEVEAKTKENLRQPENTCLSRSVMA